MGIPGGPQGDNVTNTTRSQEEAQAEQRAQQNTRVKPRAYSQNSPGTDQQVLYDFVAPEPEPGSLYKLALSAAALITPQEEQI